MVNAAAEEIASGPIRSVLVLIGAHALRSLAPPHQAWSLGNAILRGPSGAQPV